MADHNEYSTQVLENLTRLQPPFPERGLAIRQEVLETLQDVSWPVVYFRSGPGTGKTVTASLYAARFGLSAWYSLEEEDDNLYSFVLRLGLAVQRVLPAFHHRVGMYSVFHSTLRVASDLLDGFLDAYSHLSEIQNAGSGITLILDQVQVLRNQYVAWFLQNLIHRAPEGLRLFFLGRSELIEQQVLSRLNMIKILDDEDMRLTSEEVAHVVGYESKSAWKLSGGWPVAVNAHRLFLQQHKDVDLLPDRQFDMMTEEDDPGITSRCFSGILETLPPSMRDFVIEIRLLDEMNVSLCNSVAGIGNAAALLEFLVNNHYFLGKKRNGMYAFYAPFRQSLETLVPPTREEYEHLAQVILDAGMPRIAGRYAVLAGNVALMEDCLAVVGADMMSDGNFHILRNWLQLLDHQPARPATCMLKAKMYLLDGLPLEALPYVRCAIEGFRISKEGDSMVEAMRYLIYISQYDGPCKTSCDLIDEMFEEAAEVSEEAECALLADAVCCLYQITGDDKTEQRIADRREKASIRGDVRLTRMYDWLMIAVQYHAGRFEETVETWKRTVGITNKELNGLGKASVYYYVVRAMQNMDEWEQAKELEAGWEVRPSEVFALIPESWMSLVMRIDIHLTMLFREQTAVSDRNGDEMLRALLEQLRELTDHITRNRNTAGMYTSTTRVIELLSKMLLAEEDPARIAEQTRQYGATCMPEIYLSSMHRYAMALLLSERTAEASAIIEECFELNADNRLPYVSSTMFALMACVALQNRQETVATEYTRHAVKLAAQSRLVSLFSSRELYEPVINIAVDENIEPAFIRHVIDRFDYKIKKIFINCFGDFYAAPIKKQDDHMHFRTNKTRELLAFLLHNRGRQVSKSELSTALFGEDTVRNNKLLDVTIYYLRAAFRTYDLDNPVVFQKGGYSICDNQIECGIPLASNSVLAFRRFPGRQTAEAVLQTIPDLYMKDIDSPWATIQRDLYAELVRMATQTIETSNE